MSSCERKSNSQTWASFSIEEAQKVLEQGQSKRFVAIYLEMHQVFGMTTKDLRTLTYESAEKTVFHTDLIE